MSTDIADCGSCRFSVTVKPKRKQIHKRCRHFGRELKRVDCKSCAGNVQIKVFACAVHGRCQLTPRLPKVMDCQSCNDFEDIRTHIPTDKIVGNNLACIVTAPKNNRQWTDATLESLTKAGFTPYLYRGLGVYANWIDSLRSSLVDFPNTDRIMICQDDVVVRPDMHEYLSRLNWPGRDCGVVSPYLPIVYERRSKNKKRWAKIDEIHPKPEFLIGAVCFIFPRVIAEWIANCSLVEQWRGVTNEKRVIRDWHQKKAVDTFVGHAIAELDLYAYYHKPSLIQHVGKDSTHTHVGLMRTRRSSVNHESWE